MMNKNDNNSSLGKKYNIIASFNDGVRMTAAIIALDENKAYQKFLETAECQQHLKVGKKRVQQYIIFEDEGKGQ